MVNGAVPFNQKYAKSTPCFGINFAVQASKLSPDCTNRAPSLDATLPSNLKGRKAILHIFAGTNDLGLSNGGVMPGFPNTLAAYCDARRAAGWKVAVATMLPSNRYPNFADMLVAYNAMKYNNSALPMADPTFLVTEGDSISTIVNGTVPFNEKYAKSTPCFGINFAVQASKLSPDCTNRAPSRDATLPSNLKGRQAVALDRLPVLL
jgi:hypothetical protein